MASLPIDYGALANDYAAHRRIHPEVIQCLARDLTAASRVLEIGCGTGNYIAHIRRTIGCTCAGVDPSPAMLARLRSADPSVEALEGTAECLGLPDDSYDLAFSVDVIHHVVDRIAASREASRVLRPRGWFCTVTDSEWIIRNREPLSRYFPESVETELARYPRIAVLNSELAAAGFIELHEELVEFPYELTSAAPYRDKAYSALHCIDASAFQRGLSRLEADLQQGPVHCCSRYVMLWGLKP